VEALGAFSAKALARFHRTPPFTVLIRIASPTEGAIRSVVLEAVVGFVDLTPWDAE
jgi:hypothetical protein